MHNLRNNTHIQEALQPYKAKTQLVAVGGCGQAGLPELVIAHKFNNSTAMRYNEPYERSKTTLGRSGDDRT